MNSLGINVGVLRPPMELLGHALAWPLVLLFFYKLNCAWKVLDWQNPVKSSLLTRETNTNHLLKHGCFLAGF